MNRLLFVLIVTSFAVCSAAEQPAALVSAGSSDAWQRAATAARRAGYDFSDVRLERVYLQTPGARVRKEQVPENATVLRPRAAERADDSLIDYAVDDKYGGDRALKLAIKAVNRLLRKQRQELEQLRVEGKINSVQESELARRLVQ